MIFAISSSLVFANRADTSSVTTRKEKRMAKMEKQFKMNKSLLKNRDFVLEADYLQNQYGNRHFVNSALNFVAVDGNKAVIQTGSNIGQGFNTVGGITAKGIISGWKLSENKKQKTFNVSFSVTTNIGIYDLQFMIGSSDYSTARLTGLSRGQLTFEGNVVPYRESSIYEGQTS